MTNSGSFNPVCILVQTKKEDKYFTYSWSSRNVLSYVGQVLVLVNNYNCKAILKDTYKPNKVGHFLYIFKNCNGDMTVIVGGM